MSLNSHCGEQRKPINVSQTFFYETLFHDVLISIPQEKMFHVQIN